MPLTEHDAPVQVVAAMGVAPQGRTSIEMGRRRDVAVSPPLTESDIVLTVSFVVANTGVPLRCARKSSVAVWLSAREPVHCSEPVPAPVTAPVLSSRRARRGEVGAERLAEREARGHGDLRVEVGEQLGRVDRAARCRVL